MWFNRKNNSYDQIATIYDALSWGLGKSYCYSKSCFLEKINEGDKVLYLGGGTGKNLPEIMERIGRTGNICYVEASSQMLKKAKNRIAPDRRSQIVFLHQCNFAEIPVEYFDIVLTQYFLDVLTDRDIDNLFQEIELRVHNSSQWIFVDFFKKDKKRWLVFLMVTFFRVFTGNPRKDLPNYQKYFADYGWNIRQKEALDGDFIQAWLLKRSKPNR